MGQNRREIPQSRVEAILHNMLGSDYTLERPKSRIEKLLLALFSGSEIIHNPTNQDPVTNIDIASIEVTKSPNKVEYNDGDTIDFTGIEVTAYKEDNSVFGVIPFEELIFPVTVASEGE